MASVLNEQDRAVLAARLAHDLAEAAASARQGGQPELAATLEARVEVLLWSSRLPLEAPACDGPVRV
jgi:hypothetical protein